MAVKTKEELEVQAITIEPSGERWHYYNKLVMGGACGKFPAQRGWCVLIKCKNRRFQSLYSIIYGRIRLRSPVACILLVIARETSFLVCSMTRIFYNNYSYYVLGRTSYRKCSVSTYI